MAKKALDYNWALERDFSETLCKNMMNIWEMLRSMRGQREMVWMQSYRAWSVDFLNVDNNYQGRSNLHYPQLRKEVETMTRRIMKGIFTDDYLRAVSDKFEDEELTICNSMVVQHYLDNVMKFPVVAEPWVKQGVLYGTSPLRTFWRKDVNEQFFKERYFVRGKDGELEPKSKTVQKPVTVYNAPVGRAEDIFQTWVYPHNISQPSEAQAVFFRTKITWEGLLERANTGMVVGVTPELKQKVDEEIADKLERVRAEGKKSDIDFPRNLERLLQFADGGQFTAIQDNDYYDLIEIWTRVKLPDSDVTVPVVMEVLNYAHPIRIQRNPYWHQTPPFDWFRYVKPPPGEFYARGLPEPSLEMQAMTDDTLNQTMDCVTLALNPITIINPAFAPNAESFEVEPGAQWWADPQGVKNFEFPDLSETGLKNFQTLRQAIKEMSDNSPELPDPISGKARSTGQAQLAIDEWSTDLFNFLRSIATEALAPVAQKIHMMLQQNLSDDDILKITGKYAGQWIDRVVTPDDILGNYSFHWITTLQIQQRTVKAQQMLNLLKIYFSAPPQVTQNLKFNADTFMQILIRDGFGIKDTTQIVEMPRLTQSTPPDLENRIMKLGGVVKVTESDDDNQHLASHKLAQSRLGQNDLYMQSVLAQHIQLHEEQVQQKQQQMQQQMQQQQMMQLQAGKGRGAPPGGNPRAGNPTQLSQATNPSDLDKGVRQ